MIRNMTVVFLGFFSDNGFIKKNLIENLKNIRDGKNRTRTALSISEVYDGPGGGGYGLCQWTYHPRKAGLYDLAQEQNVSIRDEFIQVEWLTRELWRMSINL